MKQQPGNIQRIAAGHVPDVRKIAVLRVNALGDFLFTLPALEALRAAYPDAEIVLLAKAWHAQFLAGRPSPVDRVEVVPRCRGVGEEPGIAEDAEQLAQFFEHMSGERFDLALQLHGGGRYANPFMRNLGARVTVGLKTPDAVPLDRWIPYIYLQHEILRHLEVVSLVGAPSVQLEPRIAVTQEDRAEVRRFVATSEKPLVVLHPGATDPRRRWPPAKFAAVGDALAVAGAHVAITGTNAEREVVETVVGEMQTEALDLCGQLSLGGLTALLAQARVVVANDTGPLHLAAAVGTATVGIYWSFNLVNAGPLTRLRHRPLVSWQFTCPLCGSNNETTRCDHQVSFVAAITTVDVIAAAQELGFASTA